MEPPSRDAEVAAKAFHEAYERLAPEFGYKTREATAVPWEDVPKENRGLMIAVAAEVVPAFVAGAVALEKARCAGIASSTVCCIPPCGCGENCPRCGCETADEIAAAILGDND